MLGRGTSRHSCELRINEVRSSFPNRWSEVRVLPGPPSNSANLLKYLHHWLLAREGPPHFPNSEAGFSRRKHGFVSRWAPMKSTT